MQNPNDLADDNIVAAIREHARWQSPCELVEQGGIVMMAGQTNFPGAYKNCVARVNPEVPAAEVLARARFFFGARERGFTVLSRLSRDEDMEQLMREEGYTQRSDSPCMLVTHPVAAPPLPPNIRIESFAEQRHIRDAVAINAEAYQMLGLPSDETLAYFSQDAKLLSKNVIGCVAYEGAKPLATALAIKSPGTAGIYWVGTATAAQRMGLAGVCTAFITNKAFTEGVSVVTLQASPFGAPVYERLGYVTYDRLKFFRHLG
jgi:hypothetical protein